MLKVDIKSKIYKMKNQDFKALKNIKFETPDRGIVCILGPSGSGKTTLMNIIGALDSDFEGDVIINNKSLKEFKNKDLDSYRKNNIGFIFQQFYLINKLTAYDNIKVALDLSNIKDKKEKILSLLKEVEMDKFSRRKVNLLSGGQKQRVAIARALANDPDIILADEPTGSLDSKMSSEIMELLKELSKTKLILIITHSQELVDKYADSIINMEDGKVISVEDKAEKIEKTEISEIEEVKNNSKSGMSFFRAFKYSLKNITSRKSRVIATSIGMSIGIVGIGLALALSNGSMNIAKSQVEAIMPTNMVTVTVKGKDEDKPIKVMTSGDEHKMVKYSDIEDIKNANNKVSHYWIVPSNLYTNFFSEVTLNKENAETEVIESSSYNTMNGFEPYENVEGNLTLGRAPENEKETVLSLNTAEYLISGNSSMTIKDLIGKDLYMKFGPMHSYGRDNPDNKVLSYKIVGITSINTIGYSTYQYSLDTLKLYEQLYDIKKEDMLYVQSYIYLDKDLTSNQITNVIDDLNAKLDKLTFKGSATSTLSGVETALNVVRNVLIGFSSISVVVAILMIGIVIYISVVERIAEIGILRAIGARRKDIRNIFLSESVIIGLFAGIIGLVVTNVFCIVINKSITTILLNYGMNMGDIQVANLSNLAGVSLVIICIILSAIAGIIPSLKAAKMDPIVALRKS
ncbi:MAG: ATP-binding cassette domain-containing protein [Clostridia bacterium]|nr:ATP-binding cassette domain-containing protein [Clostridia bacterium]MDD4376333.1 ATP-binding cassette domain-containing protein [Clostridia bacterium]